MTNLSDYSKKIFILGCERSGSTWLANIFDAHPNVELLMEPFADYACLFRGFPERNTYLRGIGSELVELLTFGFNRLYNVKYPLFYRPGRWLYLKALDSKIFSVYNYILQFLGAQAPNRLSQYQLLNLHTSEIPITRQPRKNTFYTHIVTKELRLNFKVGLLSKIYPDAKYLVSIRHPGAQINSILKLFKKGHLGELRKNLSSFVEYIDQGKRFNNFWHFACLQDFNNNLELKLLLWWMINYTVLIEDLQLNRLNYRIVYHEELSDTPEKVVLDLFEFCDLNYDEQVKDYVRVSSTEKNSTPSPLNTSRDSANYYKLAINNVSPTLNEIIQKVISTMKAENIEPTLRKYLDKFYEFGRIRK